MPNLARLAIHPHQARHRVTLDEEANEDFQPAPVCSPGSLVFHSPSQMAELALLIEQEGILATSQDKWEGRTSSRQDSDIKDGTQV